MAGSISRHQTTDKVQYFYCICENVQRLAYNAFLRRKDKVRRNGRGTNEIAQRATQLKAVEGACVMVSF